MSGTLLPLRYYAWAIGLGALLVWAIISGHLAIHKPTYVCTGKYVYSKPTEWYVKRQIWVFQWRDSNSVYDCPAVNQVPTSASQPAQKNDYNIPPAASQNWTGQ